jgi:hypothetical protein
MYPFIPDDRFMRLEIEERLRRAESARLANEVRGAAARAPRYELGPEASGRLALAAPALRDQGMPPDEIDAILRADDPEVIRMYLELHRERLEEWFADQRRTIGELVQLLT